MISFAVQEHLFVLAALYVLKTMFEIWTCKSHFAVVLLSFFSGHAPVYLFVDLPLKPALESVEERRESLLVIILPCGCRVASLS